MRSSDLRGRPLSGDGAPSWLLGRFLHRTVGATALALYRTRLLGTEHVPAGGVILAGNHISYLDPVLLWSGSPRRAHFVGKAELWEIRPLGWLLDRVWVFPVRRGTADREMIATASDLLARGEVLGMFPEGTRSRSGDADTLGEFQGGVAFLAIRSGVPVVPVGIAGTEKAWPKGQLLPRFPRVTVVFGEPVSPESFEGSRKERTENMTVELARRIAAALEEARRA